MFGKAVGARDERERIIALLQSRHESILDYLGLDPEVFDKSDYFTEVVEVIMEGKNDWPRNSNWNYAGLFCCLKCKVARNWKETRKARTMGDVLELMGWYSIFMGIALLVIIGYLIKKHNE